VKQTAQVLPIPAAERAENGTTQRPLSLPKYGEATDRITKRTTHDDIRQEMNVEREP
jgi:hypothetical protein